MGVLTQKPPTMRPLWTSVALLLASLLHVEGYTCPSGKSKETITLGVGESVDFSTQEAETYGKNVKCVVKFKRGKRSKCKLNFSCSAFTLTAKNSACNKGSDFVKIGREKFCEDNSPDVTVNGRTLNVLFRSNKRSKGGEGAECTASCIDTEEASTTPASTEAPTTTRCGGCRWIKRATTCCWEDQETSTHTVQPLEAGPATSGSPTSSWSARTGTSCTRASTATRLEMKPASTSPSPAPATS